jgi:hypothetical protein
LQVAVDHLFHGLPDAQWIKDLQVGHAVEKDDAHYELIGVAHLFHRFLAPFLGEITVTPIVEQPVMQPVLIDRRQLSSDSLVKVVYDLRISPDFLRAPTVAEKVRAWILTESQSGEAVLMRGRHRDCA